MFGPGVTAISRAAPAKMMNWDVEIIGRGAVGVTVQPNVRAKPGPTGGHLAGAADDALHSRDGQVPGCWGSA